MPSARGSGHVQCTMPADTPPTSLRSSQCFEGWNFPASSGVTEYFLDDIALRFEDAIVQPGDRVKGRQNSPLLPCRNAGCVLASQHQSAVDLAKVVVVLRPRSVAPAAGASQCKGYAMPRYGNAVLEFGPVLRVNIGTQFDRAGYSFGG